MKFSKDDAPTRHWWWLAVNGPSCAASPAPLPAPVEVWPTPEQLMGFKTRDEQLAAQRLLLHAPMSEVTRYMGRTFPALIRTGDVVYIRPANPQPPTEGPTFWLAGGEALSPEAIYPVGHQGEHAP